VDFCAADSEDLLRRHLVRLRQLRKTAVARYKRYMSGLDSSILSARPSALAANKEVFSDAENLRGIERYLRTGTLPGR
jgi:polyketide biosynthesis enoyl-CoA hydratase PksH